MLDGAAWVRLPVLRVFREGDLSVQKSCMKWEYLSGDADRLATATFESEQKLLDRLGSDGWELIAVTVYNHGPWYYFKRHDGVGSV